MGLLSFWCLVLGAWCSGPGAAYNSRVRLRSQLALLVGAFVAGALIAELFGAVNLGTALGVGQIFFALALVYVLLRG
jgi:hypothetical protein